MQLGQPASRQRLEALWESVQDYRAAGDRLVLATDREARMSIYQQAVNPALRSAIEECHQILGLTPRSPAP